MELTLIQKIAVWALPVIFALTLHEVAHGLVASFFGDKTAKLAGRLTLNPIKHIDPVGTVIVPLVLLVFSNFIFGWSKPVPIDSRNMKHPRRDMAIVALAGPFANFIMAFFWAAIAKIGYLIMNNNPWAGIPLAYMGEAGIMINIVLAILNCIPLPPLDGGQFLYQVLPPRAALYFMTLQPYSFLILVILILTGVLSFIFNPLVYTLSQFIFRLFGLA